MSKTSAYDLKGKVFELQKACSEVGNYLSSRLDDVSQISSELSGTNLKIESSKKELASLEKTIEEKKKELISIQEDIISEKEDAEKYIFTLKKESHSFRDEAARMIDEARKAKALVDSEKEAFDKRRREFEARNAKIAELAGQGA